MNKEKKILICLIIIPVLFLGCEKKMSTEEFEAISSKVRGRVKVKQLTQIAELSGITDFNKFKDKAKDTADKLIYRADSTTIKYLNEECKMRDYTVEDYIEKKKELVKNGYDFQIEPL